MCNDSIELQIVQPTMDWNAVRRSLIEEDAAKHTTPMYRPPEVLDLYLNFIIGLPFDIWVLRFTLSFKRLRVFFVLLSFFNLPSIFLNLSQELFFLKFLQKQFFPSIQDRIAISPQDIKFSVDTCSYLLVTKDRAFSYKLHLSFSSMKLF